jgi:hypothetical protein
MRGDPLLMEVIRKEINYVSANDTFEIWPLGDAHIGSPNFDEDYFCNTVDKIAKNKNARWIGMGDMADCILPGDKRFDMGVLDKWVTQGDIPESLRKRIVKILKPIKDKCLCYLSGNHEETLHKFNNDDISGHVCSDLGLPYGGYSAFVSVNFCRLMNSKNGNHNMPLLFHVRHGAGAAQSEGARTMTLMRLVNTFSADIYLMGHLHCITTYCPERLELSGGKIKAKRLIAAITGSWLKAYEQGGISYAEMKGYKPTQIGCPVIQCTPTDHSFQVLT